MNSLYYITIFIVTIIPFVYSNKLTLKIFGVSLLLFLIAVILFALLCPLGLLWTALIIIFGLFTLSKQGIKYKFNQFVLYISQILFSFGFSLDNMGCVILAPFMNRYFIKSDKYSFGSVKHTISLVIAYCYLEGTLLSAGMYLYKILEYVDAGHSSRAIFDYETKVFKPNRYNL